MCRNVCEVPECYDNCQLLHPVHEFVEPGSPIQPSDVEHRRFPVPLNASSSSQIRSHPFYHLKTLRFALQLYALRSSIDRIFKCILLTAFNAVQNVTKCDN